MTDRELLEHAAKAAGIEYEWKQEGYVGGKTGVVPKGWRRCWNPLNDYGDCATLEAELGICIEWWSDSVCCTCGDGSSWTELFADHKDKNAARRYASTALAAEIGKDMK